MKTAHSSLFAFLVLLSDCLVLLAAFVVAYILRVSWSDVPTANAIKSLTFLKILIATLPAWIIAFASLGLYSVKVLSNRLAEAVRLLFGCTIGIMLLISINYFSNRPLIPAKLVIVYGLAIAYILLLTTRTFYRTMIRFYRKKGRYLSNLLIIGDNATAGQIYNNVCENPLSGYRVVGLISNHAESLEKCRSTHLFNNLKEGLKSIEAAHIDVILMTDFNNSHKNNQIINDFALKNHISLKVLAGSDDFYNSKIEVELFENMPVLTAHTTALVGWGRIVKRLLDIMVSGFAILFLSPLMALIAALVKLSDGGPVLYSRKRMSRYSSSVLIYKFRSHNQKYSGLDPEQAFEKMGRSDLLKEYRKNGDVLDNDPRVTHIGRILRKYSLDELPQLFSVFRGDMSLVGPRALIEEEIDKSEYKHHILSVKSGLTGLAVISGRHNINFDERRKLDVYYVQNWSFWLDLSILFRTIKVILTGAGAR